MSDPSFNPSKQALLQSIDLLLEPGEISASGNSLSNSLPEVGLGEEATLALLAPMVIGGATKLGSDTAFAHMDPPTPWITWITHCWNTSLNQNLLHPDLSPVAGELEKQLVQWLCPYFGMDGGHLTPGSTVSNLTALWAARDVAGIKRVVTSQSAHISIAKAAHVLGLELVQIPCNNAGQLAEQYLDNDLSDAALVLTAGTTSAGAIDDLTLIGRAAWTHVDAAWAGPMRFSEQHAHVLEGIEQADSIAMSAHKWMYQPKECGIVFFRNAKKANEVLSMAGPYLAAPNVGLLGSHGAAAIPLLATLVAWGRDGLAQRINLAMEQADGLHGFLTMLEDVELYSQNICGVVLWRSKSQHSNDIVERLPLGAASLTTVNEQVWVRHVSANPNVDIVKLQAAIKQALIRC